jgi:tetratricopeptide (TPR) repeat protein
MMQGVLARAMLLFDQGRYDLAEQEARRLLAEEPDDAYAHALLGLCLLKRQDWSQALREVSEAVRLGPDVAYTHYVAGHVLLAADRHAQAMDAANAAIRLDPADPAHYGLLAAIHLDKRQWREALAAAERGLELDPEHVQCNNIRGMALVKLGRRGEAGATMAQTLALDPEDAFTHANRGWSLLHEGKPKEAMEHFREALRLDPTLDWARAGIVEALKARNFVYRWMLAYFLFMSRLSTRAQWIIMLGGWFGAQALQRLGEAQPALKPLVLPIIILYVLFAIMTWLADPLFNLLLRVSRYGRLALSREQVTAANWVGGVLLLSVLSAVCLVIFRRHVLFDVMVMTFFLTIPMAALFRAPVGWPRWVMVAGVGALVGVIGWHVWRTLDLGGTDPELRMVLWKERQLLGTYAKGVLGVTILGNVLAGVRVQKG